MLACDIPKSSTTSAIVRRGSFGCSAGGIVGEEVSSRPAFGGALVTGFASGFETYEKLVVVCGCPSSVIAKSSGFRSVIGLPSFVTTASTCTRLVLMRTTSCSSAAGGVRWGAGAGDGSGCCPLMGSRSEDNNSAERSAFPYIALFLTCDLAEAYGNPAKKSPVGGTGVPAREPRAGCACHNPGSLVRYASGRGTLAHSSKNPAKGASHEQSGEDVLRGSRSGAWPSVVVPPRLWRQLVLVAEFRGRRLAPDGQLQGHHDRLEGVRKIAEAR